MNFDPHQFFIGLMDFFSILLPGALLTYLLMGHVGPLVLGDRYSKLAGAEAWGVFLFASYLFGHMVFLLGSWLDEFYDWARCYTLNTQITWLARRGRLLPWLARVLIWLVFKAERNLFYYPCASFTNAQLPLLKVAALYFDKLVLLDPVGASWDTVGADHVACDAVRLLDWRDGKKIGHENGLHYLLKV
jgi:hypothetical protein